MKPPTPPKTKRADVLVASVTPFAPRLDAHWFVCERQPSATKTVRYLVRAKADQAVLGHIAWCGRWNCYAFFAAPNTVYEHKCLEDLREIMVYLTQRQRRLKALRA